LAPLSIVATAPLGGGFPWPGGRDRTGSAAVERAFALAWGRAAAL